MKITKITKIAGSLKERNDAMHKKCMDLINAMQTDELTIEMFELYQELLDNYDDFPTVYRLLKAAVDRKEGREPEPRKDPREEFYELMAHQHGLPIEVVKERLKGQLPPPVN